MRVPSRSGWLTLTAVAALAGSPNAQTPPTPATPAIPATPAAPAAAPAANLGQVLGTVNGEKITRGELVNLLSRYRIPAGEEEQVYHDGMDTLVNTHLVNQFLARQRIPVSEEKVSEQVANLEKQLKQDGTDLPTEILRSGMSLADMRKEIANRIRWVEYLNARATDAELKKFFASRRDLFNGTQVRASHILLKVDPKASPEEKQKVRDKLLAIKKDIDGGKMSFAEAANKFSEDPANAEGAGGDVGFFSLNSGFIEEFANAAFALPKDGTSAQPVETPYGLHLIKVTDRKEGTPVDFEQNKPFVKQLYAAELQKNLLTAERKAAKIAIEPMPTDLFATTAAPAPAGAPAATKGDTGKK